MIPNLDLCFIYRNIFSNLIYKTFRNYSPEYTAVTFWLQGTAPGISFCPIIIVLGKWREHIFEYFFGVQSGMFTAFIHSSLQLTGKPKNRIEFCSLSDDFDLQLATLQYHIPIFNGNIHVTDCKQILSWFTLKVEGRSASLQLRSKHSQETANHL